MRLTDLSCSGMQKKCNEDFREVFKKTKWKLELEFFIKRRTPPPLMENSIKVSILFFYFFFTSQPNHSWHSVIDEAFFTYWDKGVCHHHKQQHHDHHNKQQHDYKYDKQQHQQQQHHHDPHHHSDCHWTVFSSFTIREHKLPLPSLLTSHKSAQQHRGKQCRAPNNQTVPYCINIIGQRWWCRELTKHISGIFTLAHQQVAFFKYIQIRVSHNT